MTAFDLDLSKYELGWNDEVEYAFDPVKGLNQAWLSRFRGGR